MVEVENDQSFREADRHRPRLKSATAKSWEVRISEG